MTEDFTLDKDPDKPTCPCGSMKNLKTYFQFGYLLGECKDCGRSCMSESRSGDPNSLVEEFKEIWERDQDE